MVCPEPASGAKDSSKGRGLPRLDSVASGRVASGRSARAVAGSKRRQREEASTDFEQVAGRGHKQPVPGSPKAGSKKKETAPKKETELVSSSCLCHATWKVDLLMLTPRESLSIELADADVETTLTF